MTVKGARFNAFSPVKTVTMNGVDIGRAPLPSKDINGSFTDEVLVPDMAPGVFDVIADVINQKAIAKFLVTSKDAVAETIPAIRVDPPEGIPGTAVQITGSGLDGAHPLSRLEISDIDVRPAPIPGTTADGSLSTTFHVPEMNPGVTVVSVKVAETNANVCFTVKKMPPPPWLQLYLGKWQSREPIYPV